MKSAFEGAEYSPSENAWVGIELELERAESRKMRKGIFFYKMLAAASITFALAVAGAGLYYLQNEQTFVADKSVQVDDKGADQESSAKQSPQSNESSSPMTALPENDGRGSIASENNKGLDEGNIRQRESVVNNALAERNTTGNSEHVVKGSEPAVTDQKQVHQSERSAGSVDRNVAAISPDQSDETTRDTGASGIKDQNGIPPTDQYDNQVASNQIGDKKDNANLTPGQSDHIDAISTKEGDAVANAKTETETETEVDPVQKMFLELQEREREIVANAKDKDRNNENKREEMWTSLGFAAGGYNGSGSHVAMNPANALAMNSTLDNQAKASGSSYSVNVSFGRRLTERLIIQGGLSYLNNSTSYTSNQVVLAANNSFKPATFKDLRASESSFYNNTNIIPTAPHEVNSSLEFISLPVQAGYLIIDRKFGLQLNAGVSTDFFIQNTIDPQGSDLQKTTQSRGDESPYRSTNFSGLLGTELTYRLGENYRLSLNPGLRYPFNSIFKDETGIESLPLTFDVGLRFRYIFR